MSQFLGDFSLPETLLGCILYILSYSFGDLSISCILLLGFPHVTSFSYCSEFISLFLYYFWIWSHSWKAFFPLWPKWNVPMFSSGTCTVSHVYSRSLIYLECILIHGVKYGPNFMFPDGYSVVPISFIKKLFFISVLWDATFIIF